MRFWALDAEQICLGMVEAETPEEAYIKLEKQLKRHKLLDEWVRAGKLLDYFEMEGVENEKKQ